MSPSEQIIAIIGSTGNQGSSVLESLLLTEHPIRALTHSPSKLINRTGPNLTAVKTDISNSSSSKEGLQGVWALFVNTLSDYSKPEGTEEALLRSIIDTAAESGVEWLVLSTLPEGMPARAYIEKSNAAKYAREVAHGLVHVKFSGYMKPVLNPADGFVEFIWSTIDPTTKLPLVSALTDLGPIVKAVLEDPNEWEGMEIPIVGDVLTIPEVAETYTKVTGQPARAVFVHHIPQEAIPQWIARHKGYKEVGYFSKYVGREHEIPVLARKLFPGIKTFEQWMRDSGLHLKREK